MRGRGQKIKGNFLNAKDAKDAKDAKKLPREFKKKFNLENPPLNWRSALGFFWKSFRVFREASAPSAFKVLVFGS